MELIHEIEIDATFILEDMEAAYKAENFTEEPCAICGAIARPGDDLCECCRAEIEETDFSIWRR